MPTRKDGFPNLYNQKEIDRADRIRRIQDVLKDIAGAVALFVAIIALLFIAGGMQP